MSWISWWKTKWPSTAVAAARWRRRKNPDAAKARARALETLAGQESPPASCMSGCRRYTEQAAAAGVAEMVQGGYVNDARYAEARAHALLAARKSRRAAAQNLRQKGLSPRRGGSCAGCGLRPG